MSDLWPLFVGRFQPFHKGHLAMVRLILSEHQGVRFGIGSSQYRDTLMNPFSFDERAEMISATMDKEGLENYGIVAIEDLHDDEKWASMLMGMLPGTKIVYSNDTLTIGLLRERGADVRVLPLVERDELSGTEVRRRIMEGEEWERLVPDAVREILVRINGFDRIRSAASKSEADQNKKH